ncbi:MAG: hypothetical protein ACQETD_04265 [Pseudomonadota bacterium]
MRRTLLTLLAVITLLTQWGLAAHAYHDHDSPQGHDGTVCEICISAAGHAAASPATQRLPSIHGSDTPLRHASVGYVVLTPRHYATRAPPASL